MAKSNDFLRVPTGVHIEIDSPIHKLVKELTETLGGLDDDSTYVKTYHLVQAMISDEMRNIHRTHEQLAAYAHLPGYSQVRQANITTMVGILVTLQTFQGSALVAIGKLRSAGVHCKPLPALTQEMWEDVLKEVRQAQNSSSAVDTTQE